jgi:hypothetical protein
MCAQIAQVVSLTHCQVCQVVLVVKYLTQIPNFIMKCKLGARSLTPNKKLKVKELW